MQGRVEEVQGRVEEVQGRGEEVYGRGEELKGRAEEVQGRGKELKGRGEELKGRGEEVQGRGDEVQGRGEERLVHFCCGSDNSSVVDASPRQQEERAIEKGMQPLYVMTKFFLDVIQPANNDSLADAYDLDSIIGDGDPFTALSDLFVDDWQSAAKVYLGYLVCVGIGVALLLIVTIGGLCFCCCKCCCRKKGSRVEKKGDKYKRVSCGVTLAFFNTVILPKPFNCEFLTSLLSRLTVPKIVNLFVVRDLGVICTFVTNELLREQTASDSPESLLPKMAAGLDAYNSYIVSTTNDINKELGPNLESSLDNVIAHLDDAPQEALDAINDQTQVVSLLNQAIQLATADVGLMAGNVTFIEDTRDLLISMGANLTTIINGFNSDVTARLTTCPAADQTTCDSISSANSLTVDNDYSNLPSLTSLQTELRSIVSLNLQDLIEEAIAELSNVSSSLLDATLDIMDDVSKEVESVKQDVLTEARKQSSDISSTLMTMYLNDSSESILEYQSEVDEYGNYRYYVGLGLGCLLLLISLFFFLGLMFGACGEPPDDGVSGCTRGVGATILIVGVAFTFLFYWLLIIILMSLFLSGGLLYTETCRPVINKEDTGVLKLANSLIEDSFEEDLGLSISTFLRDCEDNFAIYKALHLEKVVDLDSILNLDNFDIDSILKDITFDTSNVEILSAQSKSDLETLRDIDLDGIDFNTYSALLSTDVLSKEISTFKSLMETSIGNLGDASLRSDLLSMIQELHDHVNDDMLQVMKNTVSCVFAFLKMFLNGYICSKAALSTALNNLKALVDAAKGNSTFRETTQKLINDLESAEVDLRANGGSYLTDYMQQLSIVITEAVQDVVDRLQYALMNTVGRCAPLYNSFNLVFTDSICVDLLDPYNGFWFSIGWCLFFLLPCIILAANLAPLYRKTELYYDGDHKSFDDPSYDAYAGVYPGDNIPLEDMNNATPGKTTLNGGPSRVEGMRNPGYTESRYPQSSSSRYPQQNNGGATNNRSMYQANTGGHQSGAYFSASLSHNPPHYNRRVLPVIGRYYGVFIIK
ncbi:hypothetical protein CAPTEDRAFT_199974 [Capitella teleta]|uniref:Prominin n=1 Tax=Capitella teleta TaxID=283909 RepID=R7TL16_CAPTE|nr:hypothetical protein CAPTEDRAFT_199974 [Capitella teleta]|eukprot:ELT92251.1 hypothetical protein CAPTEDRAFT_199974 [Capitella teleta]